LFLCTNAPSVQYRDSSSLGGGEMNQTLFFAHLFPAHYYAHRLRNPPFASSIAVVTDVRSFGGVTVRKGSGGGGGGGGGGGAADFSSFALPRAAVAASKHFFSVTTARRVSSARKRLKGERSSKRERLRPRRQRWMILI